jgi:hypothetical protein
MVLILLLEKLKIMMKQQQVIGDDNMTSKVDISKKSTNIGDSIPVDNSVAHYELPNLTQCNI